MNFKERAKRLYMKYLPVKKDRVLFMSYYGHYSDSPMYVSQRMHELKPELEQVWLVSDKYRDSVPDYCTKVKYNSLESRKYYGSAHVIVDNTYCEKESYVLADDPDSKKVAEFFRFCNDKKSQKCYTTWHSTSVKKMGIDIKGSNIRDFFCPGVTMLLDSDFNIDLLSRLTFNKLKYVKIGCPRNDVLYNIDPETVRKTKEELGIPLDKKIFMYAPTFRESDGDNKNILMSGIEQMKAIDFDRLFDALNKKFGGDWVFVCRFHYHVQQMVDWEDINRRYPGKVINGNKIDEMSRMLMITDILVTDASSSSIDFSITGRPSFLFFPDLDHYVNEERGMYFSLDELPSCAVTFEEFLENIKNFDPKKHEEFIDKLNKKCNFIHNPNSARDIAEYILKDSGLM